MNEEESIKESGIEKHLFVENDVMAQSLIDNVQNQLKVIADNLQIQINQINKRVDVMQRQLIDIDKRLK